MTHLKWFWNETTHMLFRCVGWVFEQRWLLNLLCQGRRYKMLSQNRLVCAWISGKIKSALINEKKKMIEERIWHNLIQDVKMNAIIHRRHKWKQSNNDKYIEVFVTWCPEEVWLLCNEGKQPECKPLSLVLWCIVWQIVYCGKRGGLATVLTQI